MNILGLNAFHGDSAACLYRDGKIVVAAEEERFRRIKHWAGFPSEAIRFCLSSQGMTLADIDCVAINTDPKAARWKKLAYAATGKASPRLLLEKLNVRKKRKDIRTHLLEAFADQHFSGSIEYVEHHLAHLASAYHVSPFTDASVVSVDGFGDFCSAVNASGSGGELQVEQRVYFPHSLGIFYQALTQYLGFPNYGDEYKVMGLAPYGEPKYREQIDEVLQPTQEGLFELNLEYFVHHKQPIGYEWDNNSPLVSTLYSQKMEGLFGPARSPGEELQQQHRDLARSIQDGYERCFFHMLNTLHQRHGYENIAVAGGCGMNSVANGKIHLNTAYNNVYVQSAAGDAGGAIGAAMIAGQRLGNKKTSAMTHAYLGPEFSDDELKLAIDSNRTQFDSAGCEIEYNLNEEQLYQRVTQSLIAGGVIGWFQGAMEWGPRALGNRSILGDPRRQDMKDILNLKIKRRESFRPFAPSVLREHVGDWFESDADVPFMMKVFQIREDKRAQIPAVTHVDGSGRLQTVTRDSNPRYYGLIHAFYEQTDVPMLLNTSFNENEPVVCQPQEAIDCFLRTKMDMLVLGSHLMTRS